MNVGFINPPAEFLIDQRVFVPLGILRVATVLEKYHNVKFLDLSNEKNYFNLISFFIISNKIDVICLTSTTPQIEIVYDFCKYIKNNFNTKIILGGQHITLMYSSFENGTDDIKNLCDNHINDILKYVDTIVIGDGEYAITDAIQTNERIINSEKNNKYFINNNYDSIAIANRKFLNLDTYHYTIDGNKATNIISQMGCPYQCHFCSGRGSKTFNKIRKRSVENVITEIDILYKEYNYTGFMFYDDELNLNRKYFNTLLEELTKYQFNNNVKFNLRGFTRSDLLDDEQAKLMYIAGFRWLLVGFESGSDKILTNINKGCTVNDNTKCFDVAKRNNLKIKALMSIGHPGESSETIEASSKWLNYVKPDETDITIVSVYPGSNYFNKSIFLDNIIMKYKNDKTEDSLYIKRIDFLKESNFYKSKSDNYVSYVYTDELSFDDIVKQRLLLEKNIKKI